MKIFILVFLCWSKFVIYNPIVAKTTAEWENSGSIPPRFSKRTKQLLKKQWWAKFWTILLSIIPLGPISMIATLLLLRGRYSRGILIKDELKKQIDHVENFKEELRESKRNFLKSITESINKDKRFDWRQVVFPGSIEDLKLRELLLQLESMGVFNVPPKDPKYRKKYEEYLKNKDKKELEIPLLDNDLAYEAYGIKPAEEEQEVNQVQNLNDYYDYEEEYLVNDDSLDKEIDPSEYEEEYEYDEEEGKN